MCDYGITKCHLPHHHGYQLHDDLIEGGDHAHNPPPLCPRAGQHYGESNTEDNDSQDVHTLAGTNHNMTDRYGGVLTGQVIIHNEIFGVGTVLVGEVVKLLNTSFIVCDCPVGV